MLTLSKRKVRNQNTSNHHIFKFKGHTCTIVRPLLKPLPHNAFLGQAFATYIFVIAMTQICIVNHTQGSRNQGGRGGPASPIIIDKNDNMN